MFSWCRKAVMCDSITYPYFPHGSPPPLQKFQFNLIHFFKFFGFWEPPTPQEFPIPSVGGVWIFSGTAQFEMKKINHKSRRHHQRKIADET